MMTMAESAARHMAAGVMGLDELARLVEQDTGRTPSRGTLKTYLTRFRAHGEQWISAHRDVTRHWRSEHPEEHREASRRWKADNLDRVREINREASKRWKADNPSKVCDAQLRWYAKNPAKRLLNQCQRSARTRGHECTITADDIEAMLAPMTCSATGLPLTWEHGGDSTANPWGPSIDRLDCSRGYVPGNVRVVCWAFNQMRGDFPDEVVIALAKAVAARAP